MKTGLELKSYSSKSIAFPRAPNCFSAIQFNKCFFQPHYKCGFIRLWGWQKFTILLLLPKGLEFIWSKSIWKGTLSGGGHGNLLQYSCLENPHGQRSLVGYSPLGRSIALNSTNRGKTFIGGKKKSRKFLIFYILELSWLWLAALKLWFLTLKHLQTSTLVLLDFVYIGCHSIRTSSI